MNGAIAAASSSQRWRSWTSKPVKSPGPRPAPLILAYIILRGHKLSWARGEMTAVTSIAAFGLIVYGGIIDKPGEPAGLISLRFGWILALLGVIAMLVGSALRASEVERARKPPGVL